MKALLISMGTRGDIEPFLAVGEILREKGWDVVCLFPEQFRMDVETMSFRFHGFDREFLELLNGDDAKHVLGGGGSAISRLRSWISLARSGYRISKEMIALQHEVQKKENADRVIYHPKCNFALVWGMANPGKSIMLSPIPGTAHRIDNLTVLWGDHGRTLNRLSFWFVNTFKSLVIKSVSRKFKNDQFDMKIGARAIKRQMLENELTLYTVSPTLFPKPSHWPPQAKVVGYFERDKSRDWVPSEHLSTFLSKYKKVVFISFGSMTNPEPRKKTETIVDVLRRNRIPAIINTSWGGLEVLDEPPEHVIFVDHGPYDWLFPQIFGVVHHGGSGSTHMALKYGLSSLVIPHAVDQPFWARIVKEQGAGPMCLPINKLSAEEFEIRLLDLYDNEIYELNARTVAEKMKSEADPELLYRIISPDISIQ